MLKKEKNYSLRLIVIFFILFAPKITFSKLGDIPKHSPEELLHSNSSYKGNSGNNPYETLNTYPKDSTFIADTGGDLDKYVFKSDVQDGKIKITLPVTRFFGDVDTKGKLKKLTTMIKRGIIGKEAKLLIHVYDVDDDYQGSEANPEDDVVVFNGKRLKESLSSGNETWSTRSYTIPMSEIKFPSKPSKAIKPAENIIEILLDTQNEDDIWAAEVDWIALIIKGMQPIVLIHGHGGGPDTWGKFTPFLKADNAPFYLPESSETESYGCISDNAKKVGSIVEKVKKLYGVEKVNLVTHSRGGADSRIYIRKYGTRSGVNELIQLAGPNHGAGIGAFATSCSGDDLQRGHFRDTFNYQKIHIPVKGLWNDRDKFVPLYTIESRSAISVTVGDADWVVDERSATFPWSAVCKDKEDIIESKCPKIIVKSSDIGGTTTWPKTIKVDRIAKGLDHGDIHDDKSTYDWVINRAGLTAKKATQLSKLKSAKIKAEEVQLILNKKYSINIGAHKTHEVKIEDTSKVYFQITYPLSSQLNSTLTDSNGISHSPLGEQKTGFGIIRRYVVENPVKGEWNILLHSIDCESYLLDVWQIKNNIEFRAGADKPSYLVGEKVMLYASLKDNGSDIPDAVINATVVSPDKKNTVLVLYDDATHGDEIAGDGVYTNTYTSTLTGMHSYSILAKKDNVQRQVTGQFSVFNNTSVFTDVYSGALSDTNTDGFAEALKLSIDVDFLKAGDYEVIGSLKDANDKVIQTTLTSIDSVIIGKRNVSLNFDGELIYKNGVDGKLTLFDLMLRYKVDNQFELVDYKELAYETTDFSLEDFQHSLVVLKGNYSDKGVDTNSDSFFDLLRVGLDLEISKPGNYQVIARLITPNGLEVEWSDKVVSLVKGVNQIFLDFNGKKIHQSQGEGAFFVKDLLIIGQGLGNGVTLGLIDVHTTGDYKYSQFQSIPTDLEITPASITFSNNSPSVNEKVQLNAVINNNGASTSESILVQLYEGNPLGSGTQIGSNHTISGLATNSSVSILQKSSFATVGNKEIYVVVNKDRGIVEYDYSNNSAFKILSVSNNRVPVAVDDLVSTKIDTAVTTNNVLLNDTDPDGDTLSVSTADTTSTKGGSVVNHNNGTFTYTPKTSFTGTDTFKYTVSDGKGGIDIGTVTISVKASSIKNGDANGDGKTNSQDLVLIINHILATQVATGKPDCNGDGKVNSQDIVCVVNKILG